MKGLTINYVKLSRRDLKPNLIVASRRQSKPQNLFVNESLTPAGKTLFYSLRQLRHPHPNVVLTSFEDQVYDYTPPPDVAKECSSFEGRVFVYNPPPNVVRKCSSLL